MNTVLARRLCLLAAACGCVASASAQWCDNFDTYASGSTIAGQGGWAVWCDPPGLDALVSSEFSNSAPNSLRIEFDSDVVQEFSNTSGQWVFTAQTYVPSTAFGAASIILVNTYCPTVNGHWSTATALDADQGMVVPWPTSPGVSVPLVLDQWIEYRLDIDLDTDTFSEAYNGQSILTGAPWSTNVDPTGGAVAIAALDLYGGATSSGTFIDDVALVEAGGSCPGGCVGDLNGDGSTDLADLGILLADFGCTTPPGPCVGDLNGDGNTDLTDLGILLADFGCTP
jgi:hypothetical protein